MSYKICYSLAYIFPNTDLLALTLPSLFSIFFPQSKQCVPNSIGKFELLPPACALLLFCEDFMLSSTTSKSQLLHSSFVLDIVLGCLCVGIHVIHINGLQLFLFYR